MQFPGCHVASQQDRRDSAERTKAVKWVSVIGLLAAAGFWSLAAPFDFVVRFVVTAGAGVVMLQAWKSRHYADAIVFGALVVLYNPLAPAIAFSGAWQRLAVSASALPF